MPAMCLTRVVHPSIQLLHVEQSLLARSLAGRVKSSYASEKYASTNARARPSRPFVRWYPYSAHFLGSFGKLLGLRGQYWADPNTGGLRVTPLSR